MKYGSIIYDSPSFVSQQMKAMFCTTEIDFHFLTCCFSAYCTLHYQMQFHLIFHST